jgi:putative phosphoribosyl transferase
LEGVDALLAGFQRFRGNVYHVEELSWRAPVFRDRRDAGRILGELLAGEVSVNVVYGLAAGGVPVALEAAGRLGGCLDIVVVKKITYPWTTEAGYGAVAVDGTFEYDVEAARMLGLTGEDVARRVGEVLRAVRRRTVLARGSSEYPRLEGASVVVVDDGIATGYTMRVAVRFLRRLGAGRVYAAAPTASVDGALFVGEVADAVYVANLRGGPYYAVADAYMEWHDVSDEELLEYVREARRRGLLCPWLGGGRG